MSEEEKTQEQEKPAKGVSKAEFNKFQKEVSGALGSIVESLNELKSKPQVVADSDGVKIAPANTAVDEAGPQVETLVPPAWRKLTDEILGPEFKIELVLPENGGQHFVVHVPREKSNATKDHWDNFNRDKRTRELGNTGIKGVKEWLLRIRKNLISSGIKLPYYEVTEAPLISVR